MQIANGVTFPVTIGVAAALFVADASGSGVLLVTCIGQYIRCSAYLLFGTVKREVVQDADPHHTKFCPAIWLQNPAGAKFIGKHGSLLKVGVILLREES